ncbi:MAG: lipoate--protein ligase [Oscillospiraceae bacterium]|nr:lipoate--protein ligase [Oscillospiraceae bacterium]
MPWRYIQVETTDPAFNLALEEYVFESLSKDYNYFILWQNASTVVVGRHQNTFNEVDEAFIRDNNITVVRRLSGGGAVYHDLGNLNFTFIQDAAGKEPDLGLFCRPVAQAIRTLGAEAEVNGRNDITIGGLKFSGNAQYVKNSRVMHHGTLLFDSQLEVAAKALRPDPEKIKAKGVASVRSRITNLKPLLPKGTTLENFRDALRNALFENEQMETYSLTDADLAAISALKEARYGTWAWNWGASPACDMTLSGRVEGCGYLSFQFRVEKGFITDAVLYGDFFSAGDPQTLARSFIGHSATPEGFKAVAEKADIACISGLTTQGLTDILLK